MQSLKVAIYVRCSTKKQSLETQLTDLESYASSKGYTVTHCYREFGVSGAKTNRPQLNALLKAAKAKEFQAVLVWKLDRFGRSLSHLVSSIKELDALGVVFISFRDSIDLSTPAGRLMFHMLAAIAEFERDLIRDRVVSGIEHCKATGITKSGKWFGRKRRFDHKAMLECCAGGMSQRDMATRFGVSRQAISKALSA